MRLRKKHCPKCGAMLKPEDGYCIKCGYSFHRRRKKFDITQLLIGLAIVAAIWIVSRIFLKKPIIPTIVIDLIKNITTNKTA